jgi:hypothetical protein
MMQNFWARFPQASCLPDSCNCELVRDGWIHQPSAFWSSLIYIVMGLLLIKKVKDKTLVFNVWITLALAQGVFSHLAHATFLKLALAMDFAGIIVIISFFSILKFFHHKIIRNFLLYYVLLVGAFYYLNLWVKVGLCVGIFVISVTDIINSLKGEFKTSKTLHQALGILFVSFTLFIIDETRLICDPESWLQGHSIWHFGSSLSIYYYGKWRFLEREPFKAARDKELKL